MEVVKEEAVEVVEQEEMVEVVEQEDMVEVVEMVEEVNTGLHRTLHLKRCPIHQ